MRDLSRTPATPAEDRARRIVAARRDGPADRVEAETVGPGRSTTTRS